MKRFFAASLVALLPGAAGAVAVSTDFSDMWWNPAESGWGANMIQQGDTLFITLFVYDANNQPTWFVAPDNRLSATTTRFEGRLYRVTGPYFGSGSFNPTSVNAVDVGSITFDAPFVASGTLTYTVNGVTVAKSVVRQKWRDDNFAGNYFGATVGAYSGCPSNNGSVEAGAVYQITQTGTHVVILEAGANYQCTWDGTLAQQGKLGFISGTGTCNGVANQAFTMSEVQVGHDFFAATFGSDVGACRFRGRMAGARRFS